MNHLLDSVNIKHAKAVPAGRPSVKCSGARGEALLAVNSRTGEQALFNDPRRIKAWKLNTEPFPAAERRQVWSDAMRRICLPVGASAAPEDFRGRVHCLTSPLGVEFALVEADALDISGGFPEQSPAIWLTLLLEGDAEVFSRGKSIHIAPGDILYGPTGVDATLRMLTPFRQLFIKAPRMTLNPRFIAPLSVELGHIPGDSGISHVLSAMLRALASVLEEIKAAELGAVEIALTEFFLTCLGTAQNPATSLGGTAGARAACLHRICQTIETRLGDPDLTVADVAQEHGVSPRYLQKLFALAGRTFSSYVRTRRLERCRSDLTSPLYVRLSISEICFRWGFNCSSHFSRAFREQYNASPRQYRRSVALQGKNVS